MSQQILWQYNDNLLQLTGLKDYVAGTYINDATVTATLYDEQGNAVAGATDLTMSYVSGSNGNYRVTIPYSITCTCHKVYIVKITANGGAGLLGFWEIPLLIEERTQT